MENVTYEIAQANPSMLIHFILHPVALFFARFELFTVAERLTFA
jgi:hypothetical protein